MKKFRLIQRKDGKYQVQQRKGLFEWMTIYFSQKLYPDECGISIYHSKHPLHYEFFDKSTDNYNKAKQAYNIEVNNYLEKKEGEIIKKEKEKLSKKFIVLESFND